MFTPRASEGAARSPEGAPAGAPRARPPSPAVASRDRAEPGAQQPRPDAVASRLLSSVGKGARTALTRSSGDSEPDNSCRVQNAQAKAAAYSAANSACAKRRGAVLSEAGPRGETWSAQVGITPFQSLKSGSENDEGDPLGRLRSLLHAASGLAHRPRREGGWCRSRVCGFGEVGGGGVGDPHGVGRLHVAKDDRSNG